jgi:hypothetical protein
MFDHVPHTPFQGLIINGNTSPPQIAGHAHDIRYRTKHPIDLQATSLQSSPTLPHPSSSRRTLSLSLCPSLRLNITKTLCFRTGGHEIAPIILCPNPACNLPSPQPYGTWARLFHGKGKKTRGRDTMDSALQKGDQPGGFHRPSAEKTPWNSEARFDVFGLEYRSVTRNDRTTERTNGTEEP